MKPITVAQWNRMSVHQKSWITLRAIGQAKATVLFGYMDRNGKQIGGTPALYDYCRRIVEACNSDPAGEVEDKIARPVTIRAYACFPHVAGMWAASEKVMLWLIAQGKWITLERSSGEFYVQLNGCLGGRTFGKALSLPEALCQLALVQARMFEDWTHFCVI